MNPALSHLLQTQSASLMLLHLRHMFASPKRVPNRALLVPARINENEPNCSATARQTVSKGTSMVR